MVRNPIDPTSLGNPKTLTGAGSTLLNQLEEEGVVPGQEPERNPMVPDLPDLSPPEGALDVISNLGQSAEHFLTQSVPQSAQENIAGLAQMVAHPVQTGQFLGRAALGGVEHGLRGLVGLGGRFGADEEKVARLQMGLKSSQNELNLESAKLVADVFKSRYGSTESAINTMYSDPFGFMGDLAMTLGISAGTARGAARLARMERMAHRLAQVQRAADVVDPIVLASKGALEVARPLYQVAQENLTTKVLSRLEGHREVKPQFILDQAKRSDIRQAESQMIERVLADMDVPEGGRIDVQEFNDRVQTELLPLEASDATEAKFAQRGHDNVFTNELRRPRYEEKATLPQDVRGNVANYIERVYESPIKTSAGHMGLDTGNYFAHARIEDIADQLPDRINMDPAEYAEALKDPTNIRLRRIIEVQSDLFQKGRLKKEALPIGNIHYKDVDDVIHVARNRDLSADQIEDLIDRHSLSEIHAEPIRKRISDGIRSDGRPILFTAQGKGSLEKLAKRLEDVPNDTFRKRSAELAPLQPYRNTWHERILREEIQRAAADGKTKLQLPTGETAMQIEGLGGGVGDWLDESGRTVTDLQDHELGIVRNARTGEERVVIGEGPGDVYYSVQKEKYDEVFQDEFVDWLEDNDYDLDPYSNKGNAKLAKLEEQFRDNEFEPFVLSDHFEQIQTSSGIENHPVYKFYEGDIPKFLKKIHPEMRRAKDGQGVEWFEIDLTEADATKPIEAFQQALAENPIPPAEAESMVRQFFDEKEVPIEFVDNIQTPAAEQALGVYYDGMISFIQNPDATTPAHEAVHAYMDLFTAADRKTAILAEVQKRFDIADATAAEERLADLFVEYTRGGKVTLGTKMKAYFDQVIQGIKSLVGKEDKVKQLFADLVTRKREVDADLADQGVFISPEARASGVMKDAAMGRLGSVDEAIQAYGLKSGDVDALRNETAALEAMGGTDEALGMMDEVARRLEEQKFQPADISQSLLDEVGKYKTAEEFVKAQPKVFHGGRTEVTEFKGAKISTYADERGALFASTDKQVAESFGEKTTEVFPNFKNPLIVDAKKNNYFEIPITKELRKDIHISHKTIDTDSIVEIAQQRGHDGVIIKRVIEGAGEFDPSDARDLYVGLSKNSILTKSQLTDIYNQAKKSPKFQPTASTPKDPMAEKAKEYGSAAEFQKALDINYEDSWRGAKHKNADKLSEAFDGYYFHGTDSVDSIKSTGWQKRGDYFNSGVYFANTPDESIRYMKQLRGGGKEKGVIAIKLDDLRIKRLDDPEGVRHVSKVNPGVEEMVEKLKRQGYDGIRDEWQTLVWNTDKLPEAQTLKDIYNQAKKSPKFQKAAKVPEPGDPDFPFPHIKNFDEDALFDETYRKGKKNYKLVHTTSRSGAAGDAGEGGMWFDVAGGFSDEIFSNQGAEAGEWMTQGVYNVKLDNPLVEYTTADVIRKLWGKGKKKPKEIKEYLKHHGDDFDEDLGDGFIADDEFAGEIDVAIAKEAKKQGYDAVWYEDRGHGGEEIQLLDGKKAKLEHVLDAEYGGD
jgi:hypothetical protein